MPYDDRDVKKMLETQLKGKVKFPSRVLDRLDPLVISLINNMLEVDITKRYNIDKVLKHPWLADVIKPQQQSEVNNKPTIANKIVTAIRRQTVPNNMKQIT